MPDFLNLPPWTNCIPLYLHGNWWLCRADVAIVLGISAGSGSPLATSADAAAPTSTATRSTATCESTAGISSTLIALCALTAATWRRLARTDRRPAGRSGGRPYGLDLLPWFFFPGL